MSGRQRHIRKTRMLSFDEDEGGEEEALGAAQPPAAVKAAHAQRKAAAGGKPSLLSFGDDMGRDGCAPDARKKTSTTGTRTRPSLRVAPPPSAGADREGPTAFSSGAGEYTVEKLSELRKNARSFPGASDGSAGGKAAPAAAGGFKLAGSFKAAAPPKDDRFQYDVRAAGVVKPTPLTAPLLAQPPLPPPSEPTPPPPPPPGGPALPPPGQQQQQQLEDEEDLDIPDEEMIKWAKAKRERLRAAHMAPDYMPLHGDGPGGLGSRLRDKKAAEEAIRPMESGSDEEPEESMRLQFMGKASAPAPRDHVSTAPVAPADEDGEEEDVWAHEQIRKGMGGLLWQEEVAPADALRGARDFLAAGVEQQAVRSAGAASAVAGTGTSQAAAVAAAASEVMKTLQAGVARLQMSQQQAEKNLARTAASLQNSLAAVGQLEDELAAAGERYAYIQRLRAYVADLCNMLADKSPLVEELEEQQQAMQLQRAEQRRGRARADDDEAFGPAEAAVSAVLGVLSRGGTPVAAAAAGEAAATAAEATAGGAELPVELDEFGRDVNAERKYAAAERARQRGAKLAELQARLAADPAMDQGEPRLGEESSDEEDEDDGERWAARQVEVQEAAAAVFRDAADEYASLGAVKRQLEEWKAQQPTSYRDAYVSLSAPAIFAPFVRLELLAWQPLAGGPSFDAQAWYRDLFDFGQPQDPSAADPEDPDNDLVPQLVAKLVLPLARHQLAEVWRPHSVRESAAAATLLSDLLVYLPPEDPGLRETLELVQVRLEGAVEGARLPPWPPAALAACPRAAALLAARFGRSVRLLRAACAFAPVLPRGWLQRLVLERLLAAQLLPYARSASGNLPAAADRASRLAEALLSTWFAAGTLPPRGAEGLVELLSNLARSTAAAAGEAGARAANTAAARQLAAALHRLGQPKAANEVAKAYGVL